MEYDKAAFTSAEAEIPYWADRIRLTKQYLEYLHRMHADAVRRLGAKALGETEQEWLGNE